MCFKGPWVCDSCGQAIEKPEDGMFQWLSDTNTTPAVQTNLRIVHHPSSSPRKGNDRDCYQPERGHLLSAEDHLSGFVSPDGLVRLLAKVAEGQCTFEKVSHTIMRLFVPGYEKAYRYFRRAREEGVTPLAPGYFLQSGLQEIINIHHWKEA